MTEAEFNKLPLAQRVAIQQRLIDAGLYAGKPDGRFGPGTATALKAEETRRIEGEERSRKGRIEEATASADAEKKKAEADRERARAEAERAATERKAEYGREASSPAGIGTQIGAGPVSFIGGYAAGRGIGSGINALADRSQESKNQRLAAAAQDRLNGLTTREGSRAGTTVAGAMPSQNSLLRVGGRMLPHAITGAGMMAKGGTMLAQNNEDDPFYAQMANRAAGVGMLGTGVGIIEQGANYAVNPGVAPDARSIAIIESNQLRRNGRLPGSAAADRGQIVDAEIVPDAPAQKALPAPEPSQDPAPGSKAYYVQEAKRLGVKGVTRKSKADLVAAVNEANAGNAGRRVKGPKVVPGIAGPAIAGGLAYMMTPDDANASTGDDSVTGRDEALTNAGIAGGLTYGMGKVLPAGAGALAGGMMGPVAVMDGPTLGEEEAEETANWIARQAPGIASRMPGRIGQAYEKAQVPERSPANSGPRNALASGIPYRDNALGTDPQLETIFRELQSLMGQ
jgi:hypothetical protein